MPSAISGSTATVSLPSAVINTVGTYTLRTIFTDGSGCKDTACATITVAAQPTINVPPTTLCQFTATNVTATGGTGGSYAWSYGNGSLACLTGSFPNAISGSTATVSLPNAVINTVGTYTIRTIFTDGSGCKDTACATITVAAQPTINVPPTTLCQFTATNVTATGGTGGSYAWSYGNGSLACLTGSLPNAISGSTATVSLPSAVINTVGTYTLRTIFTDGSGCKDTACATITVAAQPTINVPPTTLCQFTATNVTATGGTGGSYAWSYGNGSLACLTGSFPNAISGSTATVSLPNAVINTVGTYTQEQYLPMEVVVRIQHVQQSQ
ncbi:MAG: hypothetical protein IPN93_13340 [Bacteroidetes bacterium]|nr:hypothetical protein [Bacteroidota bacterium]